LIVKKIVCLFAVFALCMAGCQPGHTVEDARASLFEPFPVVSSPAQEFAIPAASPDTVPPVEETTLDKIYGAYRDPDALLKFADGIDASSRDGVPFRREFTALVKGIEKSGSDYMLTVNIDKVELTGTNGDPAPEPYYTNEVEQVEDIAIRDYNLLILVNPHNHFQVIAVEGLQAVLENCEYEVPYHFYSVNGEIKILMEMMLP